MDVVLTARASGVDPSSALRGLLRELAATLGRTDLSHTDPEPGSS